jgi:DNA polymerase-3 subunit epsilon
MNLLREIVLDTETTGLSPAGGDRLVEIGCVELINHVPTGRHHHVYINPERDMPEEAFRVHGLSEEFLRDKPKFSEVARGFVDFIGGDTLIIHNAPFDMGFLNAELERSGLARLANEVIDTVMLARQIHPGARVSLDALCKHYGIDNSRRTLHGALLDSEILAEVYLELIGGRQVALALSAETEIAMRGAGTRAPARPRPAPLPSRLTVEETTAHAAFVAQMGESALWLKYESVEIVVEER